MGIKHIDSIGEKKGALGSHALTKKGLRHAVHAAGALGVVNLSEVMP